MKIILQPCGNTESRKHYNDTIENPVHLEKLVDLPQEVSCQLRTYFPKGKVPIWGVTPGKNGQNIGKWEKIERGDVALFSREGSIFASGAVVLKLHSKALAEKLWGFDSQNMTWEYIYFLDETRTFNISYEEFNKVVGYKDNFVIQGFSVLDEGKSDRFFDYYGRNSLIHPPLVGEDEYRQSIVRLQELENLEVPVKSLARKEQSFIRNSIFRSPFHTCAICGKTLPIELLVAAHIKKRALCSIDEKLDFENIIMPACKLGCDELFERGFIGVNGQGVIEVSSKIPLTNDLEKYLHEIKFSKCSAFTERNAKYFEWHYTNYFRNY